MDTLLHQHQFFQAETESVGDIAHIVLLALGSHVSILGSQNCLIGGSVELTGGTTVELSIGGSVELSASGSHVVTVGSHAGCSAGGSHVVTVGSHAGCSAGGSHVVTVGSHAGCSAGGSHVVTVGSHAGCSAGGSHVVTVGSHAGCSAGGCAGGSHVVTVGSHAGCSAGGSHVVTVGSHAGCSAGGSHVVTVGSHVSPCPKDFCMNKDSDGEKVNRKRDVIINTILTFVGLSFLSTCLRRNYIVISIYRFRFSSLCPRWSFDIVRTGDEVINNLGTPKWCH